MANSLIKFFKEEKGESNTNPAMDKSFAEYIKAVAAPILLPQIPIELTLLDLRKKSTTQETSSCSCQPNDIYSPSLFPQPEKSKANTVIPFFNKYFISGTTSQRDDEFP